MYERRPKRNGGYALGSPLLLALIGAGVVFFLIMGIKSLSSKAPDAAKTSPDTTTQAATQSTTVSPSDTDAAPVVPMPSEPVVTTAAPLVPITSTTEPVVTEPTGPVKTTVDDSYFSDSLFIGDSRTDGLWLYSTPGDCKHYSAQSMTIFDIMDSDLDAYGYTGLRALLQGMRFGKIYIMLGINECGYDTDVFADEYRKVVEEIRSYQPEALIYIQSICYVTQTHEENYPVFATANIKEKNEAIKQIANGEDIFYLEVNDCLNDGTDHLPDEYTGDGAHLKARYYYLWHDYLLENAYVDALHPWEPADENTTEPFGAEVEHP